MDKALKNYTVSELRDAIIEKQQEEAKILSTTLPTNFYPYEETENIDNTDVEDVMKNYFHLYINDGCEGHDYIVEVVSGAFGGAMEHKIKNAVIHHFISKAKKEGWDSYFENVSIEELGRYGVTFLMMKNQDDDQE